MILEYPFFYLIIYNMNPFLQLVKMDKKKIDINFQKSLGKIQGLDQVNL